jgi:hypothetical protein
MGIAPVMHYRAESMVEKTKTEAEPIKRPPNQKEHHEDEWHQPSWIQKYLDLADLLMKRGHQRGTDDDKAA